MGNRTALYDQHVALGARMVDFGGWDMPLHYGSQIQEHHAVRQGAGMFDVSHMTVIDLAGAEVRRFLRRLLANDVGRLKTLGKALYSCMLNETGGVVDDLIAYYLSETGFRLVVNAATRDKDLAWIRRQGLPFGVEVRERQDLALIAVQGPDARARVIALLDPPYREEADRLQAFFAMEPGDWLLARTGYTGEDGFEMILPGSQAPAVWERLAQSGVAACGLGARDTLRLEAGMNLYGADMDETVTPLESGLGWTVAWDPQDRDFIGREALERQKAQGLTRKRVGLVLNGRGVLRNHQRVSAAGCGTGEITSGGFAPTLGRSIALARVPGCFGDGGEVEIRAKGVPVSVVKPPFVRYGKACIILRAQVMSMSEPPDPG